MESAETGKDTPNKPATMETISRTFVGAAAVSYVTGFAIQTLHLSRYGLSDSSPLRAEYILTGCAALVPLVLPVIPMLLLFTTLYLWRIKKPEVEILWELRTVGLAILAGTFFIVLATSTVYGRLLYHGERPTGILSLIWSITFVYFSFVTATICLAVQTGEITYRKRIYKAPRLLATGFTAACSILPIIALLDYANAYVEIAHARIPSGFGGARPIHVQLLFDPASKPHFIQEESPGCSFPYLLHAQSESCYLVTPIQTEGRSAEFLQIRKDHVIGLRLLRQEEASHDR